MRTAAHFLSLALAAGALALGGCEEKTETVSGPVAVRAPPGVERPTAVAGYGGIGATLDYAGTQLVLSQVRPGTPAERAGLKVGDPVLKIDGVDTSKLAMEEAVKSIRGEVGTTVTLTIGGGDAGAPHDVTLTREAQQRRVPPPSAPGAQPPVVQPPVVQPTPAPGAPAPAPQRPTPNVPPPAQK